jgi:hypothetical protein
MSLNAVRASLLPPDVRSELEHDFVTEFARLRADHL